MRCYIWAYRGPRRAQSKHPARYLCRPLRLLRITLHTWRALQGVARSAALRSDLRRPAPPGTARHRPAPGSLPYITLHAWRRNLLTKRRCRAIHDLAQRGSPPQTQEHPMTYRTIKTYTAAFGGYSYRVTSDGTTVHIQYRAQGASTYRTFYVMTMKEWKKYMETYGTFFPYL